MAVLPYSRVVNVSLTRNDNFPSRRGFGTPIILTTFSVDGAVDSSSRTKLYASMEEVADDWAADDGPYRAALSAFSQNPRPIQIKVGYIDENASDTAEALQGELDLLYDYDQDWYFLTIDDTLRVSSSLDGMIEWVQAKPKLAIIDSNDAGVEDPENTTSIAARNKNEWDRTGVFYHPSVTMYPAASLAAYMSTRNFDDANTAYTAKFKGLPGISSLNVGSAKVTAVTGFTPGVGQSSSVGHMANSYIDIGGQKFVAEGSTLTQDTFLDEIHAQDWIIARTEEEMLAILLNNARVPFTDAGMETLASGVRTVMQGAVRAGFIDAPLDPATGEYKAEYEITVPSVFDVTESQRKARIAPAIVCRFRYAGAVHYVTANYFMNF